MAKANLEFFGYSQEYLDNKKRTGRRYANIITRNFSEFTDAGGQLFADAKMLRDSQNNYQWLITATTEDGRFAHLGFQASGLAVASTRNGTSGKSTSSLIARSIALARK